MSLKLEEDGECGDGREPETGNGGTADDRSLMTMRLNPGWIAVDPDWKNENAAMNMFGLEAGTTDEVGAR